MYCFHKPFLDMRLFHFFPSSFLVFLSEKLRSERIKVSGKTTNQKSLLMTMMELMMKMMLPQFRESVGGELVIHHHPLQ